MWNISPLWTWKWSRESSHAFPTDITCAQLFNVEIAFATQNVFDFQGDAGNFLHLRNIKQCSGIFSFIFVIFRDSGLSIININSQFKWNFMQLMLPHSLISNESRHELSQCILCANFSMHFHNENKNCLRNCFAEEENWVRRNRNENENI